MPLGSVWILGAETQAIATRHCATEGEVLIIAEAMRKWMEEVKYYQKCPVLPANDISLI